MLLFHLTVTVTVTLCRWFTALLYLCDTVPLSHSSDTLYSHCDIVPLFHHTSHFTNKWRCLTLPKHFTIKVLPNGSLYAAVGLVWNDRFWALALRPTLPPTHTQRISALKVSFWIFSHGDLTNTYSVTTDAAAGRTTSNKLIPHLMPVAWTQLKIVFLTKLACGVSVRYKVSASYETESV